MLRSRYTTELIVSILQVHAAGASPAELMWRRGISRPTFRQWKNRFGRLRMNDAKRLRTLEDENARLKRLVANWVLSLQILRDVLGKER